MRKCATLSLHIRRVTTPRRVEGLRRPIPLRSRQRRQYRPTHANSTLASSPTSAQRWSRGRPTGACAGVGLRGEWPAGSRGLLLARASRHATRASEDDARAVRGNRERLRVLLITSIVQDPAEFPLACAYSVVEWTSQNEMAGTALFLKIMVCDPAAGIVSGDYSMASDGTANRRV